MHFLSIESSTKNFAIAISDDKKVLRHKSITQTRQLEDVILKHIDALLKLAKVPFKKIDAFVISLGPGSFTSLRVGLATIKSFCMATKKPLVGICSLDVIAHGVADTDADEICVIVDARRHLVYSAIYQVTPTGLNLSKDYALSPLADVLNAVKGKTIFVGDAIVLYKEELKKVSKATIAKEALWSPKAKVLAKLGAERLAKKAFDDPANLVPIYLYEDACQVTKKESK